MDATSLGMIEGQEAFLLSIAGPGGVSARILTWGARLAELWVPDRAGAVADIVLGHDSAADWQASSTYFGATCGRYANRIAGARFVLDGREVQLDANEGAKHLHGGAQGFDRRHWAVVAQGADHVTLALTSEAGDMGYPGRMQAQVDYRFDAQGRLHVTMTATTDAPTIVNLVNHAYFNMAGQGAGPVLDQRLQIHAAHYTPVDADLIPDGQVLAVAGTPFDFTTLRAIGAQMPGDFGFDHNFCLSGPAEADGLRLCAVAEDPASGRRMQIRTDQPGVQFYTGAYLDDRLPGKRGAVIGPYTGFCLETQIFPDSPNRPHFPDARLNPGDTYRHRMVMDFSPALC